MLALRKALAKRDLDVRENELRDGIDAYILNSIHFDVDRFMEFSLRHRLNVIHRMTGRFISSAVMIGKRTNSAFN